MAGSDLVRVFTTEDAGALPLATMTLDQAGIEYIVRNPDKGDSFKWMLTALPTNAPVHAAIYVATDVAAQARELLADLESAADEGTVTGETADASPDALQPRAIVLETTDGRLIGEVTEEQLQELLGRLGGGDTDTFVITPATLDDLADAGVAPSVIDLLRPSADAAGDAGVAIRWAVR